MTTTLESPFVTILSLGLSTTALARKNDRISAIREIMREHDLEPATMEETRGALRTHNHPGFDIISLEEDDLRNDCFFAIRMTRDDLSHREIRIPRGMIDGKFQWFCVKQIP